MKNNLGKNVLYTVHLAGCDGQVSEGQVHELSPSGKCVRIGYHWHLTDKVSVIEEIPIRQINEIKASLALVPPPAETAPTAPGARNRTTDLVNRKS